jgi:predicted nucleotidyltransferase
MTNKKIKNENTVLDYLSNDFQNAMDQVLSQFNAVLRAWIFGSYARGTQNEKSDLDVMVELDNRYKWSMFDLIQLSFDLSQKVKIKVDIVELGHVKEFAQAAVESEKIEIYVKKK